MKLIGDSGSSKTEWALVDDRGEVHVLHTRGFNPYFDREITWYDDLTAWFEKEYPEAVVSMVYYYGAGCGTEENKNRVKEGLKKLFRHAKIMVSDDLTGSARALFAHDRGVVVILGTGTNVGLWNGDIIIKHDEPRGFLLGDHGSGAVLGLRLLHAFFDRELSEGIRKVFDQRYHPGIISLKKKLYTEERPNYYLASFAPFLAEKISDETILSFIEDEFRRLFRTQILPIMQAGVEKVRCSGSVAYYFRDILIRIGAEFDVGIDRVVQYPLKHLVDYHLFE